MSSNKCESAEPSAGGKAIFIALIPWLLFTVLVAHSSLQLGSLAALAAAVGIALPGVRKGRPKLLEVGAVVTFIGFVAVAFLADPAMADRDVGVRVRRDGAVPCDRGHDQHAAREHHLQLGDPACAGLLGDQAVVCGERRRHRAGAEGRIADEGDGPIRRASAEGPPSIRAGGAADRCSLGCSRSRGRGLLRGGSGIV